MTDRTPCEWLDSFARSVVVLAAAALAAGCGRAEFDGERAFRFLERQCEFGPRTPGSPGHAQALEWIAETVGACAEETAVQRLTALSPTGEVELANVIASFRPRDRERVLFAAHWDTRATADREEHAWRRTLPIPGANDGASGVAVLLELATVLREHPPRMGVDLVFFDGEDGGGGGGLADWCLGSTHYAALMGDYSAGLAVVVDMVGDRDLSILKEANSLAACPEAVERVWRAARRSGATRFRDAVGSAILDDHVPLLRAGIPAVLVIDTHYPPWHTLADTPDKCSPESLEEVGRVLLALVS